MSIHINEEKHIITMTGIIDDDDYIEMTEYCSVAHTDDISVIINSCGGDVYTALGIYDCLSAQECNITTTIAGVAASAASIIFLAGDKRNMSPNSTYMVHQPSTSVADKAIGLCEEAQYIVEMWERLKAIYRKHCPKLLEKYEALLDLGKDIYLTANECEELEVTTTEPRLTPEQAAQQLTKIFGNGRFIYIEEKEVKE